MKKIIITVLILMNVVTVNASSNDPKYKIIANSNSERDIKEMYKIKDSLIIGFQPSESYTIVFCIFIPNIFFNNKIFQLQNIPATEYS